MPVNIMNAATRIPAQPSTGIPQTFATIDEISTRAVATLSQRLSKADAFKAAEFIFFPIFR